MLKVTIKNAEGQEILSKEGEQEIAFLCERTYEEGDRIVVESSEKNCFLWLQVDEVLGRSMIYLKDAMEYIIPFGEKRLNKSPKAFCGSEHFIWLKRAKEFERKTYRNLALNVNDQSCSTTCYPHVSANVETRGEAIFAAVNVVDGVTANEGHWKWPFQAWGINRREDAAIKIDFGREVEIDLIKADDPSPFPALTQIEVYGNDL